MLLSVTLLAASASVIQASPAPAQPNCLSNYGSLFSGMTTSSTSSPFVSYVGASALLVPRYGHLCDYNPNGHDPNVTNPGANFNVGWSMAANGQGRPYYAQTGYYRGWGQNTYFFWEHRGAWAGTFTRSVEYARGAINMGGINRYWVQFVGDWRSNAWYRLNIDSTIIGETPWNPYAVNGLNIGNDGARAQFSGETKYQGSDMPGTQSVPALFQGLELQRNDGPGTWTTAMPTFYGAGPGGYRYGFQRDTTRSFKIWTF